jgi:hypothetical protein
MIGLLEVLMRLALLLVLVLGLPCLADDFSWETDLKKAEQRARSEGKPLLIVFRCLPWKDCAGFDGQLVRPPKTFLQATTGYVCARVTDMRGVDLDRYSFDFDLTFAALVVHPDGPVLHRYGGRDHHSADSRLSMTSLVRFLKAAEIRYAAYGPSKRPKTTPRSLDEIPVWREKMAKRGKKMNCYHCHFVFDAEREQRRADGTWTRSRIWRWPTPERVGLSLEVEELGRIGAVEAKTPAAKAGLRAGDRLLELGDQPILTALDDPARVLARREEEEGDPRAPPTLERGDSARVLLAPLQVAARAASGVRRETAERGRAQGSGVVHEGLRVSRWLHRRLGRGPG